MFNFAGLLKTIQLSRFHLTRTFTQKSVTNFPFLTKGVKQNQVVRQFHFQTQGVRRRVCLLGSFLTVALCDCQTTDTKGQCNEQCKKEKKTGSTHKKCKCDESSGQKKCTYLCSCDTQTPVKWEKQELTHCFLMKQANVVTIDSVTRILSETVSAIEDYHTQYRHLLEILMELMEESRCSTETRQELINCKSIVVRSNIEDMKGSIIELECYLESVTRLANAAAETAFLGNAEYASTALMERLNSAKTQVSKIKEETQELEKTSNELQALIIVESGQGLK